MPIAQYKNPPSIALIEEMSIPEPNSGCWLWLGNLSNKGYGRICYKHKKVHAHRLSFEVHRGPIPLGMCICHRCDMRMCVNPDHLFLGTPQDNTRDMMKKGRQARGKKLSDAVKATYAAGRVPWVNGRPEFKGENQWNAKLTDEIVVQIRLGNEPAHVWAERTGASCTAIKHARTRRTWKHVK